MERKTIIIIIIVVVLCTSLSLFFYLRNASNKSKSHEDHVIQVKQDSLDNEAKLKAQAREVFMKEELKGIETEIKAREELILIQGGKLDESIELKQLKSDREALREEAEELFEIMYTASQSILGDELDTVITQSEKERLERLVDAQKQFDDLQSSVAYDTTPLDDNVLQQMSPAQLVASTAAITNELMEHIPQENENPSSEYINLRRKLQQLAREKTRRGEVNYGGGFPDHWTPRPSIETKDIVQFPLEWGLNENGMPRYGISGSSTIRNWISSNLKRDEASGTIGPSPMNT